MQVLFIKSIFVCGSMLLLSSLAHPQLIDRGGGLVYDTVKDITWLANANYAASELSNTRVDQIISVVASVGTHTLTTTDYLKAGASDSYTGQMTWWGAIAWADQLVYYDAIRGISYDDWRLPAAFFPDSSCTNLFGGSRTDSLGYNCIAGELGHLFYNELGGVAKWRQASLLTSTEPDLALFLNLQLDYYHISDEYAACPNLPGADCGTYISFYSGSQWATMKRNHLFVWAVRDGDVASQDIDGDGLDNLNDNCPIAYNPNQADIDNDGMGDVCDLDNDNDGLSDVQENLLGTDPLDSDSDDDGLSDGDEVNIYQTNPLFPNNPGDLAPRGAPDGILNAADVMVLTRLLTRQVAATTAENVLGDLNNSGMLDVGDLVLLERIILGLIPAP